MINSYMYNPEINSNLKRLRLNTESMLMSPPEDSSKKTTIELDLLENIGRRLKDVDIDTIKEYNENLLSKYMNILNQFSLPVDICEITELLDDVKKIVMMEKRKNHRSCKVDQRQRDSSSPRASPNKATLLRSC